MRPRAFTLIVLIYILVGIYVAWVHHYLTLALLKNVASALIVIFLWFLVLLGANLHIG
jgi:hypothetical protein